MPRLPRLAGSEVVSALRHAGWQQVPGSKGSHVQLKHPSRPGRVTVPIHSGETLDPWLLSRILKQAGLTADEFRALL